MNKTHLYPARMQRISAWYESRPLDGAHLFIAHRHGQAGVIATTRPPYPADAPVRETMTPPASQSMASSEILLRIR